MKIKHVRLTFKILVLSRFTNIKILFCHSREPSVKSGRVDVMDRDVTHPMFLSEFQLYKLAEKSVLQESYNLFSVRLLSRTPTRHLVRLLLKFTRPNPILQNQMKRMTFNMINAKNSHTISILKKIAPKY